MNDKIASKTIGVYVNMAANPGTETYETTPDWQLTVCSTSKGFNYSKDPVDTASDCDGDWAGSAGGRKSWGFSNSFFAAKNIDAGSISLNTMLGMLKEDENRQWKLESIDDGGDDLYIMGYASLNGFDLTGETGNFLTGSLTLGGDGEFEHEVGT